jgi:hypothetical protein
MSEADKPPSEPPDLPIKSATTDRRPRGGLGGVYTHDLGKPPVAARSRVVNAHLLPPLSLTVEKNFGDDGEHVFEDLLL